MGRMTLTTPLFGMIFLGRLGLAKANLQTKFEVSNCTHCWWRGTVVERRSLAGELSLSCARPAADG